MRLFYGAELVREATARTAEGCRLGPRAASRHSFYIYMHISLGVVNKWIKSYLSMVEILGFIVVILSLYSDPIRKHSAISP